MNRIRKKAGFARHVSDMLPVGGAAINFLAPYGERIKPALSKACPEYGRRVEVVRGGVLVIPAGFRPESREKSVSESLNFQHL